MKPINLTLPFVLPFVAAMSLFAPAQAAILSGQAGPRGEGDLVLVVYDPVAEVSYTKDLGLNVFPYTKDDKYTDNFFVNAQQDAGYQKFFDPLNTDPNFQQFRTKSTNVANQVWGIYSSALFGNDYVDPNSLRFFTTLNSDQWSGAGTNPQYENMRSLKTAQFIDPALNVYSKWFNQLNVGFTGNGMNPFNTHVTKNANGGVEADPTKFNYQAHGSSFDAKGMTTNFKDADGLEGGTFAKTFLTTNKVGSSSWFYYLTVAGDDGAIPVLVDEFDNLKHDAYWGLAVDEKGDYILSFTQQSALTQVASALGQQRRNLTDFAAAYGQARVLSASADEFAGWVPSSISSVSAVPEPSSYGLMALGLLAVAVRARSQVHSKASSNTAVA